MAKKVFYNKRHKIPKWLQPYLVWIFLVILTTPILIFWGTTSKTPRQFNISVPALTYEELKKLQDFSNSLPPDWYQRDTYRNQVIEKLRGVKLKNYKLLPIQEDNCIFFIVSPDIKTGNLTLLNIPWNSVNGLKLVTAALPITMVHKSLLLVFTEENPRCSGYRQLRSQLKTNYSGQVTSGIVFYNSGSEIVNPATGGYRAMSLDAAALFAENKYAGFAVQVITNALPLLFRESDVLLLDGWPLVKYPLKNFRSENLQQQVYSLVAKASQSGPEIFAQGSLWLSEARQLKKGAAITIVTLIVVLCFIPVANRLTLTSHSFSPVSSAISATYFSLVPVLVSFLMQLLPRGVKLSSWVTIFSVGTLGLFALFKRLERNMLSIATDSVSALFFFFIMIVIGAIINPAVVFLFFPIALLYGFIKESSAITAGFLFLLGMAWPLTFLILAQQQFDFLLFLSRQESSPEFSWGMAIYLSLFLGSVMSLTNRNVPRTP